MATTKYTSEGFYKATGTGRNENVPFALRVNADTPGAQRDGTGGFKTQMRYLKKGTIVYVDSIADGGWANFKVVKTPEEVQNGTEGRTRTLTSDLYVPCDENGNPRYGRLYGSCAELRALDQAIVVGLSRKPRSKVAKLDGCRAVVMQTDAVYKSKGMYTCLVLPNDGGAAMKVTLKKAYLRPITAADDDDECVILG